MQEILKRTIAGLLMAAALAGLLTGTGGHFSVLYLALAGFIGLAILGDFKDLKKRFSLKWYGLGLLMALGVLSITGALNYFFNHHATANPTAGANIGILAMLITEIIPSLIGEELMTLIFYKVFGGGALGVVASTLIFAAAHGPEYHWNPLQLVSLVAIRLVFSYILIKKGVQTAAALHITYDSLIILPTML